MKVNIANYYTNFGAKLKFNISEADKTKYSESINYLTKWFEKITRSYPNDELIINEGNYRDIDYTPGAPYTKCYLPKERIESLLSFNDSDYGKKDSVKTLVGMLIVVKSANVDGPLEALKEMTSHFNRYRNLQDNKILLKELQGKIVTTRELIKETEEYFDNEESLNKTREEIDKMVQAMLHLPTIL
ncbi:MAG: hypothetical protein MJ180_03650 [Candidatus Gastranaerophilales bacterium]|nr:hypothetical protein [Candidatus Gastranaerophilales bacterium]